jgi:hypothetical protein
MTPLARFFIQELMKPKRQRGRWFASKPELIEMAEYIGRAQFFEITEVRDILYVVADKMAEGLKANGEADRTLAFLPAPITWIEQTFDQPEIKKRASMAILLIDQGDNTARVHVAVRTVDNKTDEVLMGSRNGETPMIQILPLRGSELPASDREKFFSTIYATLSIINSPAVFEREVHEPHRGIARRAKTEGLGEIAPWHQIKLSISREAATSTGHGEVTGQRCLHWVRAHPRFRLGRWEVVKFHQRGNIEHGISLGVHKVTP